MNKIIPILVVLVLLAGCGENIEVSQTAQKSQEKAQAESIPQPEGDLQDIIDTPRAQEQDTQAQYEPEPQYTPQAPEPSEYTAPASTPEPQDSTPPPAQQTSPKCTDSDGGTDYSIRGYCKVEGSSTTYYDRCWNGIMKEMVCENDQCKAIENPISSIPGCAGCYNNICYPNIYDLEDDACDDASCDSTHNCVVNENNGVYTSLCQLKTCDEMGYTLCQATETCSGQAVSASDSTSERVCCKASCTGGAVVDLQPENVNYVFATESSTAVHVMLLGEDDLDTTTRIDFQCEIPSMSIVRSGWKNPAEQGRTAAICFLPFLEPGSYDFKFTVNHNHDLPETDYDNNVLEDTITVSEQ